MRIVLVQAPVVRNARQERQEKFNFWINSDILTLALLALVLALLASI
jgi:hypothetical protein